MTAFVEIEYEDGRLVRTAVPDGSLLHHAAWIDWLIAAFDPGQGPVASASSVAGATVDSPAVLSSPRGDGGAVTHDDTIREFSSFPVAATERAWLKEE